MYSSSSVVPGCQPELGSTRTLRGPDGLIVNGTIIQQDDSGHVVETPQGLMRVPYSY